MGYCEPDLHYTPERANILQPDKKVDLKSKTKENTTIIAFENEHV